MEETVKLLQEKSKDIFEKLGVETLHAYYIAILEGLMKLSKTTYKEPVNWSTLEDKYKVDALQELYIFIKYLSERKQLDEGKYSNYRATYEDLDVFLADPVLKMLIDYKALHYADEIFAQFGLEILERKKDGGILVREIKNNEFKN